MCHSAYVKVKGTKSDLATLKQHLKIPVANRYFRVKASKKKWDGYVRFYNTKSHTFSRGLLPHVRRFFKANDIPYTLKKLYHEIDLSISEKILPGIKLHHDQIWAVERWLKNGGYGLLWCAVAAGKTEMACSAIKLLLKKKIVHRVLFAVNGLDLLNQAINRVEMRLGFKPDTMDAGRINDTGKPVIVGSLPTIYAAYSGRTKNKQGRERFNRMMEVLSTVGLVIQDEVHHARSRQTQVMCRLTKKAKYRMGISTMPFHKYDREDLQNMTAEDVTVLASMGSVVARTRPSTLIKKDRLAQPYIYLVPIDTDTIDAEYHMVSSTHRMSWAESRKRFLVGNKELHKIVVKCVREAVKADITSLVVVGGSRSQGLKIYNRMNRKDDIEVAYLHGGVDSQYREKVRRKMNKGDMDCVIATTIYDEGVDLPEVRLLVQACGGLSAIKTEQRIGRALRKKKGGQNAAIIIDFMFYGNKHLQKHSYARLKQYIAEEGYRIHLVDWDSHSIYTRKLLKGRGHSSELPNRHDLGRLLSNENHNGVQSVAST